jgi:hypothetical protein
MAEQDKTYVPGYWRAAKNTRTKKEKSSKPEKVKTVTVTKEGPLTKQQLGKITLNSIKLARNLSALPTIAKEVKQLSKNLKALSETKNFSKRKGKGVDVTKFLIDNISSIASVATLGAYAATDTTEANAADTEQKNQEYKQSVYDTKSLEEQAAEEREAYSQGSNQQQPVPVTPPPPAPSAAPPVPPAQPPLSPMVQNAMPGATLRQQAGLPAMIPTRPAPATPALRPGEVSGTIRRTDSSTGGGRGYINPELVRGTDIEIPANVVRDGQGNPVRTEDGGFVVSGQPGVTIPNPPAPVPVRPAPTPTRPTPTPSRPTPTRPQEGMVKREGGLKAVLNFAESSDYNQLVYPLAQYRGTKTFSSAHDLDQYKEERKRKGLAESEGAPSKAPLTDMTLQEVLNYQTQMIKSGKYPSSAVGKYQIIQSTLKEGIKTLKLNLNDKFDEKTQDRLYEEWLIGEKRKAIRDYISGKSNDLNAAMIEMAKEFASFPVPKDMQGNSQFVKAGQSYYAGDGVNQAHVSIEQSANALMEERANKTGKIGTSLVPNRSSTPLESSSQENLNMRTEASRPTVNIPQQSPPSNQASGTIRRTQGLNRKPPVDWSQQAVPRQLGGS